MTSMRQATGKARQDTPTQSRGTFRPSFAEKPLALQSEGAGNAGRPMRPQPRV